MKIEEAQKDLVILGEDTSQKATISDKKLAKLQYLLTKGLYKDPITAVVAEWVNNGIDSVVQAGKDPIENPVVVSIKTSSASQTTLSVEDKGVGLDDVMFRDICMNYLESTKEEDNDTIGHFGIGMKSFLSLERSATFTCRRDGIERRYLVYEGAEFVNYDLLYEIPTTEGNGVKAELQIINVAEKTAFITKAVQKLAYYDTAVLVVDDRAYASKIFRTEFFQISTQSTLTTMHLCLKDVYYPIDWDALGMRAIDMPIALRFHLTDGLTPTPSRESYITNEFTKNLIINRIKDAARWMIQKYNADLKEFPTFMDAYMPIADSNYYIQIGEQKLRINNILNQVSDNVNPYKVKGIKLLSPLYHRQMSDHYFDEYSVVAQIGYRKKMESSRYIDRFLRRHVLESKRTVVIVNDTPIGNVREFLKSKYPEYTSFVKQVHKIRKKTGPFANGDLVPWTIVLNAKDDAKIAEFDLIKSTIISTFHDERGVEQSKEFIDWVEAKKESQREARKDGRVPANYNGLGKKLGDVTLAYAYKGMRGTSFKKQAYPIDQLHKTRYLTVLVTEDEEEEAKKVWQTTFVRFALVGKNELKKVPICHQFINYQEFMSRECKPFLRLASALKFEELATKAVRIKNFNAGLFSPHLRAVWKDLEALTKFSKANLKELNEEAKAIILSQADAGDLYDKSLWSEYLNVKAAVDTYNFVYLLEVPKYSNSEQKREVNKLISEIVLFRKKYRDEVPAGITIKLGDETI